MTNTLTATVPLPPAGFVVLGFTGAIVILLVVKVTGVPVDGEKLLDVDIPGAMVAVELLGTGLVAVVTAGDMVVDEDGMVAVVAALVVIVVTASDVVVGCLVVVAATVVFAAVVVAAVVAAAVVSTVTVVFCDNTSGTIPTINKTKIFPSILNQLLPQVLSAR